MSCPFGFGAKGAEEEEEEEVLSGEEAQAVQDSGSKGGCCPFGFGSLEEDYEKQEEGPGEGAKKNKKSKGSKGDGAKGGKKGQKFDFDSDPVSWFYQNQIKSEQEFQEKKEMLRQEARKRLDAIMDKKNQRTLWPSDSEFDDLSISSGELSELDSDVHSLASLRSCAVSWIQDANYGNPAEGALRWVAFIGLALSAWGMHLAYSSMAVSRKVLGVILHADWPAYAFLAMIACSAGTGLALMSTNWRSKRLLLASQALLLAAYGATVVVATFIYLQPTEVDAKLKETACARYGKADTGSRLCTMLPAIQSELADTMSQLLWAMVGVAAGALLLAGLGCWYTMELCYVEKKAAKHLRRHKRRKHTIPWEKIKIVGPVTNCGANAPSKPLNGGAGPAGKCPVMHTAAEPVPTGPKDKNA